MPWEGVVGELRTVVEALPSPDSLDEAALRALLSGSQVEPSKAVALIQAAAAMAPAGVRSVRAYALSVLRPGSRLAEALRRREDQPKQAPEAAGGDPEARRILEAGGITPGQVAPILADLARAVPSVEPRHVAAAAVDTLDARGGVQNQGAYLRGVLARAGHDAALLRRARRRQEEAQAAPATRVQAPVSGRPAAVPQTVQALLQTVPGAMMGQILLEALESYFRQPDWAKETDAITHAVEKALDPENGTGPLLVGGRLVDVANIESLQLLREELAKALPVNDIDDEGVA